MHYTYGTYNVAFQISKVGFQDTNGFNDQSTVTYAKTPMMANIANRPLLFSAAKLIMKGSEILMFIKNAAQWFEHVPGDVNLFGLSLRCGFLSFCVNFPDRPNSRSLMASKHGGRLRERWLMCVAVLT